MKFTYFSFDTAATGECEADGPEEIARQIAAMQDDGTCENASIGVRHANGSWYLHSVRYHRETTFTMSGAEPCVDPIQGNGALIFA